jgi:7-keto-8-aminopelargonate synthetase-like enzyme
MAVNEAFAGWLSEGMKRYGTNYSSSRLSNLRLEIFAEAERYLATVTGAQAAVTVSSGYMAGQMTVKALQSHGQFAYAPHTHPAVWLDQPVAEGVNYADWTATLLRRLEKEASHRWVVVCNSLDPLLAQKYDFQWLHSIPARHNIILLIDDSHGFGLTGQDGRGIISELSLPSHIRLVVVSSLGKALGIPGGIVLGDEHFIGELRKSPFFGASSPVIPAYLYAFLHAEAIYRQARQQLFDNVRRFAEQISNLGLFQHFSDYPVFYTPDNHLYDYLLERGVFISSFPYPTPQDACITRVVLSALHTLEDIDRVADLVTQYAQNRC